MLKILIKFQKRQKIWLNFQEIKKWCPYHIIKE